MALRLFNTMHLRVPIRSIMAGLVAGLLCAAAAWAEGTDPEPPGQLIDVGGRRLHLNCAGTGSPTVVIENGGGSFSIEWIAVQKLVAGTTKICTYDRAGYAWSDRGPADEGIEQITADLHLLMNKAKVSTPIVLVCQSLGCLYARLYQRRFPGQVAGLVFVDGTHDEGITLVLSGERKPISVLSSEQLPRAFEEYRKGLPVLKPGSASDPPFDRLPPDLQSARHWALEKMVKEIGWLPNSVGVAESWRQAFSALRRQRLSETHPLGNLPLIVIERGKDSNDAWHSQQVQLAALSASGRLIKADGSGHMIHLERPDLVSNAIESVMSQVMTRRSASSTVR